MRKQTKIEVAEDARLVIYMDKGCSLNQDANVWLGSENLNPSNLVFVAPEKTSRLDWKSQGGFYGIIYAPFTDLDLKEGSQLYGSVVARKIKVKSGSSLHYDVALRDLDIFSGNLIEAYSVKSWQVLPILD